MKSLWGRASLRDDADESIAIQKLSLPATLEDGRVPVMFDRFSYIASGLIMALLLWGSIAEIREFARASGQVVPSSFVKLVHHLEGGQVEEVKVQEGQVVEKGEALVALRPIAAVSDLNQLKVRRHYMSLKMQRLEALLSGRELIIPEGDEDSLKVSEKDLYNKERARLARELQTIAARVSQRKVEIDSSARELESLERQVHISSEKLKIRERLLDQGYTSKRAYLDAQSELEKTKADAIAMRGRLDGAKKQLAEAESEYEQARSTAFAKYTEEYSQLAGEVAELDRTIVKYEDKVERLQIIAPVRGVVQELAHRAPGEVVKPGDLVAKIVPIDDDVVAEVNVEPKDIGHVNIGDEAEIRISTFDPNVYGVLKGKVQRLSATTFQTDPKSPPYFKAIIKLDRGYVGSQQHPVSILPGMQVEANIVTGAKSLVKYFLKPVYRSLNSSFTER